MSWSIARDFFAAALPLWFAFIVLVLLDWLDIWDRYGKSLVRSMIPEAIAQTPRMRRWLDGRRRSRWSHALLRLAMFAALLSGSLIAYSHVWQENERLKAATSPRPHVSLVMERTLIEGNTLYVEAVNIGERTASEVWIISHSPLATTAIPQAWMLYDLGPGETTRAAIMLSAMTKGGGLQGPKQWSNYRGEYMIEVIACYKFADVWTSTAKYVFFCDLAQTICDEYQPLPPADSCPQREDVAMYLYKQTAGSRQ